MILLSFADSSHKCNFAVNYSILQR